MPDLLTIATRALSIYLAVSFGLGVAFVVIEKREQIPRDRLPRWRADALAFMVGWPIAAAVIPAILLLNLIRAPKEAVDAH